MFHFKAVDLRVDESSFTGETEPAKKITSALNEKARGISGFRNLAFMGTLVRCGRGKVCSKYILLSFNLILRLFLCCILIGFHDVLKVGLFVLQGIVFGTGIHSEFGNIFKMMKTEEVFLPIFYFCPSFKI